MRCDQCGTDSDSLAGHAGAMLCSRCSPSLDGLTQQRQFTKVRLLGMSTEIADGHIALMLETEGEALDILIERADWIELSSFMNNYEGMAFYGNEEIGTGEQRPGTISISDG